MAESKLIKNFIIFIVVLVIILLASNFVLNFDPTKKDTKDLNPDEFELKCSQNVRYEIISACYDVRESEVYVKIKNSGTMDLAGFNFLSETNTAQDKREILAPGTTGTYLVIMDTKPVTLKAIPKLVSGDEETKECASLDYDITDITDC